MPQTLTWDDVMEIADALYESFPQTDPLSLSFPRLHNMIIDLDAFNDNPDDANETRLEKVQMAWYDLVSG